MLGRLSKRFIFFSLWQVFLFANSKCKRYFHNRLKPAKLTWTAMYRKQHKKVFNLSCILLCLYMLWSIFLICIQWIQPFYTSEISLRWLCGGSAVTSFISNGIIILKYLWHLSFGISPCWSFQLITIRHVFLFAKMRTSAVYFET